jgi:hypothetical protein
MIFLIIFTKTALCLIVASYVTLGLLIDQRGEHGMSRFFRFLYNYNVVSLIEKRAAIKVAAI